MDPLMILLLFNVAVWCYLCGVAVVSGNGDPDHRAGSHYHCADVIHDLMGGSLAWIQ